MCSLTMFLNRQFPLAAVRILAGKTFSFEKHKLHKLSRPPHVNG